jgi:outer membrane protein OmpA-like peptidoglycan-associated protein
MKFQTTKRSVMKYLVMLLLCVTAFAAQAQTPTQRRADRYYDRLAYARAIPLYEKLAASNAADDRTLMRLGDCYRNLGRWGKAEETYGKVAKGASPTAESFYNYAQALRANGKYDESLLWMDKFHGIQLADRRGTEHVTRRDFIQKINGQPAYFDLQSLDINTAQADFGTGFYKDKVVFTSSRRKRAGVVTIHAWNNNPFLDLFVAGRDSSTGKLSNATLLSRKTNTRYHEGPACFTSNGMTMYFTRNNYFNKEYRKDSKGVNNLKIFRAVWNGTAWVEENLPINSDEFSVGHPALSPDGNWLYFVSDMPGGIGGTDVYRVAISEAGKLGVPQNLGNVINTEGNEMFPFVDKDGNLFFASNGHVGLGGLDVNYAAPKGDGFAKPENLGAPVNTPDDDFALVLDASGKGYLSSNRAGGKGDDDIYAVRLVRPLKQTYLVKGVAKDKRADVLLAGAEISLRDAAGNVIQTVTTGVDGNYQFEVDPAKEYSITGTKEKYFDGVNKFNTNELGEKTELVKDVELEKDPGLSLYALVTDKTNGKPLDGVKMVITDNITGQPVTDMLTPVSGDFRKPLPEKKIGDRISYNIKLDKEGYLGKVVTFNASIEKAGEIKVHEAMDLSLDKIQVGADLAKIIDIKPIYFDLGKSNIRPDAAAELDKIVKVMKENPTMVIELGSHTDCRSSAASNMALSDRRAKSSAAYIISKGIDASRIYGKGYGETKLINGCACEGAVKSTCSEQEHQQNRRTEFIIVKM